jgi:NADPH:quinone reductase-like Zn-dependent oxidoreductase
MRAAAIDRFGPPQVVKVRTLPEPQCGAQEVLIAIDTAGVGIWDAKTRSGKWAEGDAAFPLILGVDGAGTVVAVGSRVKRLKKGDRVYAYSYDNPKGGFCAEYVAVAASKAARIPRGLDLQTAGAVAVIALTALQGVDDALKIKDGESVIIHGASGNVGMLAVQFAKRLGARVLAIASGRDGIGFVRRLGANEAIDGRRSDIVAAARDFAPDGIDAVLAFAGGKELTRCLDALRKRGRAAYPNGIEPEPRKRKGITIKSYDAVPGVREFERLRRAIEESKLQVPIAATFDLDDVVAAHRRVEKGHLLGKVVLRVGR